MALLDANPEDDGSYTIRVPAPPPCLPDPNSFDDLFNRMNRMLPYGYHFEALHGSHDTYDWIAIIGHRNPGTGGHGNPGDLLPPFVGTGRNAQSALGIAVELAEKYIGEHPRG